MVCQRPHSPPEEPSNQSAEIRAGQQGGYAQGSRLGGLPDEHWALGTVISSTAFTWLLTASLSTDMGPAVDVLRWIGTGTCSLKVWGARKSVPHTRGQGCCSEEL